MEEGIVQLYRKEDFQASTGDNPKFEETSKFTHLRVESTSSKAALIYCHVAVVLSSLKLLSRVSYGAMEICQVGVVKNYELK